MPDAIKDAWAAWVVGRLEDGGRTLLALGETTRVLYLNGQARAVMADAKAFADGAQGRVHPLTPSTEAVTRMDEALGWIPLIHQDRYVLRRIVGARSLVSPQTGQHLYAWRHLGTLLGAEPKAVKRWHTEGIALIVSSVQAGREAPPPAEEPAPRPRPRLKLVAP